MGKIIASALMISLLMIPQPMIAQNKSVRFSDILPELEDILSTLSNNTNAFENILSTMDNSGKTNENYSQQKNIFLSSVLAISTIKAICEYENDLMTLFIDLREKSRQQFYDVRIESLEIAVKQINTMYKQIQINYNILPSDFYEAPLVHKERRTIQSTSGLMNQMIELLKSVKRKG